MSKFRITIEIPLSSESFVMQAEQLMKLKAPLDVLRKALTAIAPDHEYHDEIIKPRVGGPRGRKPRAVVPPAAVPPAAEAA